MTMRQAPPGLTSISQTGFVKPRGPHQCAMCLGSVHALNTSSRGASKTRVMTSSRCGALVTALFLSLLAAMLLLLLFQLDQIVFQTIEALLPETAVVLHPAGDVLEWTCLQLAGPPLGFAPPPHQARALQHL